MRKFHGLLTGLIVLLQVMVAGVEFVGVAEAAPGAASSTSASAASSEEVIDMVVASVAGKPITLNDLAARLSPPRHLDIATASRDPEVRAVLDTIILEQLIQAESQARRIAVSNDEIERYLDEVAERNQLTREGFEKALESEGRSLTQYKSQIQTEILRSRIANNYLKGGVTVSAEEIDTYLEEHPELKQSGARIGLSQIAISSENRDHDQLAARVAEVRAALDRGTPFSQVAIEFSDGPHAREGGSLGILSESDLSPAIFEAVFPLKAGEVSSDVRTPEGIQIFRVDERIVPESAEDGAREAARQALYRQKLDSGMQGFFESELYKRYGVDKKI